MNFHGGKSLANLKINYAVTFSSVRLNKAEGEAGRDDRQEKTRPA